jgi:triacylglycerol esterase/lipase EstA (alpha/beta hydrolase family)
MLARAFRIAQLVELAAWLAAASWLRSRHGWSAGALVALVAAVAAGIAGIRLAGVCTTMLVGWLLRSPRASAERIGAAATAALVLGEWRALLAFNLVNLPWERLVMRADPPAAPTDRVPLVLVHGYLANRGYFRPLVRQLEALGFGPVHAPTFPVWRTTIEAFEAELHAQVERIAAGTGQRVILVAHSMGGLACRAYLARRGAARVARLVTIATPHHGTRIARFGAGANARQMQPGSAFLAALEAAEAVAASRPPVLSLYSPHDNIVVPQATSRLPGARNVALPGLGHVAIGGSPRVVEALVPELEAAGARRA